MGKDFTNWNDNISRNTLKPKLKEKETKEIFQSELNKFLKENNIIVIKEKILFEKLVSYKEFDIESYIEKDDNLKKLFLNPVSTLENTKYKYFIDTLSEDYQQIKDFTLLDLIKKPIILDYLNVFV